LNKVIISISGFPLIIFWSSVFARDKQKKAQGVFTSSAHLNEQVLFGFQRPDIILAGIISVKWMEGVIEGFFERILL
jgi:hypothetical protein